MSVAIDLDPFLIPAGPARGRLAAVPPAGRDRALAIGFLDPPTVAPNVAPSNVVLLHQPSGRSIAAPVRLTQRGVAALAGVVAALAGALVWFAAMSAPAAPAGAVRGPASITVRPGDTLWSIATRVAPERDPRAEIAALRGLNHLVGVELRAGQVLRAR